MFRLEVKEAKVASMVVRVRAKVRGSRITLLPKAYSPLQNSNLRQHHQNQPLKNSLKIRKWLKKSLTSSSSTCLKSSVKKFS